VRLAERDLDLFSLLAVPLNAHARLETAAFRAEAARLLRVPVFKLEVSRQAGSTFLLSFEDQHEWNSCLRMGFLEFGFFRFRLMPWTRQVSASVVSKLLFRVRLCIEGVPAHLRHESLLGSLFPPTAFIDEEVCEMEKLEEEECARMWLWTSDPDNIAITGTLLAEELTVLPEEHYADGGAHMVEEGSTFGVRRLGPAGTLDFDVIIHVDRVVDYSPLPDSPSHKSMASDTSGLPDEELEEEWPVKHRYVRRLGVPDRRPLPERRRVSVYERLGGRDRSPPRGGGAGGARFGGGGYFQMPPSGPHDVPDLCAFPGSSSLGGRGNHHGDGRRRAVAGSVFDRLGDPPACVSLGSVFGRLGRLGSGVRPAAAIAAGVQGQVWHPKRVSSERKEAELRTEGAEISFRGGERHAVGQSVVDPMEEEAARAACFGLVSSAGAPRSVEPTAPMADPDPVCHAALVHLQLVSELSGSLQEAGVEMGNMVLGGQGIGLAACSVPVLCAEGCVLGEHASSSSCRGVADCSAPCERVGGAVVSDADREAMKVSKESWGLTLAPNSVLAEDCVLAEPTGDASIEVVEKEQDCEITNLLFNEVLSLVLTGAEDEGDAGASVLATLAEDSSEVVVGSVEQAVSGLGAGPRGGFGLSQTQVQDTGVRLPFDLNETAVPDELQVKEVHSEERRVLGKADDRLNKEARVNTQIRGLVKYTVPLKKALLCTLAYGQEQPT
jgi:hypothetical protein